MAEYLFYFVERAFVNEKNSLYFWTLRFEQPWCDIYVSKTFFPTGELTNLKLLKVKATLV